MHLTIKERVELVLMSGADGVCYYYLNCFICFGALFMAQNVCFYYLNCFICFGALFMAHPVFCIVHVCPPFTIKRIVSLSFKREVHTRSGVAKVSGPPVFHIKVGAFC